MTSETTGPAGGAGGPVPDSAPEEDAGAAPDAPGGVPDGVPFERLSLPAAGARVMLEQLQRIEAREPGARGGKDPEDVHRMRVATRRLRAARRVFREALAGALDLERANAELKALATALGTLARAGGDPAAARALYEESLTQIRATGNRPMLALVLVNLGTTALQQGDHEQARARLTEGLRLWWEAGNPAGAAMGLAGLARLAAAQGQAARAGRLLGAAAALFPAGGRLLDGTDRAAFDRQVAAARTGLDPATFAAGWAAGQALPPERAVAYALEENADRA
jgi:tetratricopeptide (TPR) repeat protein